MIFVDTNVLLDVVENDPIWADWSRRQMVAAAGLGEVAINDVVNAKLAVGYDRIVELEAMVVRAGIVLVPIPRIALFIAGKAFLGGRRQNRRFAGFLPRRAGDCRRRRIDHPRYAPLSNVFSQLGPDRSDG